MVKRVLLGVVVLLMSGCGNGKDQSQVAPPGVVAQASSYAGSWGYDGGSTKIRAAVTVPATINGVPLYAGSVQVDVVNPDGTVETKGGLFNRPPLRDDVPVPAGPQGLVVWLDGHQDATGAWVVLTPVDNTQISCKVVTGFANASTATYRLTRR